MFSDIGTGWGPVVLNSTEEYLFMYFGMRSFIDSIPFWIGGSVNADPNDNLTSGDIIANNSGTIIITFEICGII